MKSILIKIFLIAAIIQSCHQPLPPELENRPPGIPENVFPPADSLNIPVELTFRWQCSDPNEDDSLIYDFYLEANNPTPALFKDSLATDTLFVDSLEYDSTEYFWKVVAFDRSGRSTSSPVWSFSTIYENNNPPFIPSFPQPANNADQVGIKNISLNWLGGDPDSFSKVKYDVFFGGDSQALQLTAENISGTSHALPILLYGTQFYWQIKSYDDYGSQSESPVWNFKTVTADILFDDNFDSYTYNTNPPSLVWTVSESGIDIYVSNETSWNDVGNSMCFTDPTEAANGYLPTQFEAHETGMIQFYWKVMNEDDYMGFRLYSDSPDSLHLGPQVSIREGKIQYYDIDRLWQDVSSVNTDQWYFIQLIFDCNDQFFAIYVDGELKTEHGTWLGTFVPDLDQIYFLTFENRICQKAYIDEFRYMSVVTP